MPDPVDTDALRRDARVLAPGFPGVEKRLHAAADEVDRLRAELDEGLATTKQYAKDSGRERRLLERDIHRLRVAIENAPHDINDPRHGAKACASWAGLSCNCWKADVDG